MNYLDWIFARLREPSTWRGLSLLAGIAGIGLSPEAWAQIGAAVIAVIGVIEFFRKEEK